MLTILAEYLNRLESLHADLSRTFEGLPQETLDWSPATGMNSLAVLAVHTAGAERYWIGEVAGQDPSGRDRAAEFRTRQLTAGALKLRLDSALAHSQAVLEKLSLPDLDATRTAPRDQNQVTVAWALLHALEHTAMHLGHMQIARQLWDQR